MIQEVLLQERLRHYKEVKLNAILNLNSRNSTVVDNLLKEIFDLTFPWVKEEAKELERQERTRAIKQAQEELKDYTDA